MNKNIQNLHWPISIALSTEFMIKSSKLDHDQFMHDQIFEMCQINMYMGNAQLSTNRYKRRWDFISHNTSISSHLKIREGNQVISLIP